jgi:CPA1 family monovalent cation:H+ antiporter
VQIALGVLLAAVMDVGVPLNPEIFFLLFIPPLLFLDGWRIPNRGLFKDAAIILELALSRCGQAGQRMRAVIPSFDLI